MTVHIDNVCTITGPVSRAHEGDAGYDLFYHGESTVTLRPGDRVAFPTGVTTQFYTDEYFGSVCPRSGLALKKGVTVLNAPGIVDSSFKGEIKVILINLSYHDVTIEPWDRIAQLVIAPCMIDHHHNGNTRGKAGFGSSGE